MLYFIWLSTLHVVDKSGGKAVDNQKRTNGGAFVSPYLKNRLRSLEEVERARERARLRRAAVLSDWPSDPQADSHSSDGPAPQG